MVLKIRKKGILILPKKLRERVGIRENDDVVVEVSGDKLVIRPLRPRVVDVDPGVVEELLREEHVLEKKKYEMMFSDGKNSS